MTLTKRLAAIYHIIKPCHVIADIGCDHGLLSIALIDGKIAQHVYACDVREKPLQKAYQNIIEANYENYIDTILSDGLLQVYEPFDTMVIAGMGRELIQKIISESIQKCRDAKQIVLASQTEVSQLRKWLYETGFVIDGEDIVFDKHYYQILSIHYEPLKKITHEQTVFGIHLDQHPLFYSFWNDQLLKLKKIQTQIPESDKHYYTIINQINMIEDKIKTLK